MWAFNVGDENTSLVQKWGVLKYQNSGILFELLTVFEVSFELGATAARSKRVSVCVGEMETTETRRVWTRKKLFGR